MLYGAQTPLGGLRRAALASCFCGPADPSISRLCIRNSRTLLEPILHCTMFAAASSFFARTNISQSYNIGPSTPSIVGSRTASPAPAGSSAASLPAAAQPPPFNVGPWRVQPATHKVTGKRVSVWSADKKSPDMERMGPASRERTLEVLKAEVRMTRHACCEETLNVVNRHLR